MATASIDEFLKRNRQLATTHEPFPTVPDIAEKGLSRPRILVLTCVDPRSCPETFLGLGRLEAICFRNVCGHITPHLPEISGLDQMVDFLEVMIVHHTDCGALYFQDVAFRETLNARAPEKADQIAKIDFGTIKDVRQSVLDDMAIVKADPLLRQGFKDATRGFVYDIITGLLEEVLP